MPDDPWNQDDAWAEPSPRGDADAGDGDWADDVQSGDAHYMQEHVLSPPQSGLGIASLVLSVIAGIMLVAAVIGAAVIVGQNPNFAQDDPQLIGAGCGIILGLLLSVLAGILGVVGLFQPDQSKTCAVLGIVLAGLEVFGVGGLMLVGLLIG